MSAEMLLGSNTRYEGTEALRSLGQIVHSAIHDLESFFWVLLYLCLTRDGPGGGRRNELSSNDPLTERTRPIYAAVHCLFDSEDDVTLWTNKRLLFDNPNDLKNIILKCIHPYFTILKCLISKWWTTLRFGYFTYDDYTAGCLHDRILKLLEDELRTIRSTPNLYPSLGADEVARMKDKTDKESQRRIDDLTSIQSRIRELEESLKPKSSPAGQQRLPTTPPKDTQGRRHGTDEGPVWDSTSPKGGRSQPQNYGDTTPDSPPPSTAPQSKKIRTSGTSTVVFRP